MVKQCLKNNKGFTLIEVIVVAVIIAVLSAVAIPLYNGYLRDARKNTAENVAGSFASYLGACFATKGTIAGIIVNGGLTTPIAAGTWYYSDATRKTEFLSIGAADTNRFIIPTDIQICVNNSVFTVVGAHVKSVISFGAGTAGGTPNAKDSTQAYHYH